MSNGPRYRGKTFHEYMSAKFWHPASKRNIVTVWKRKQQMEADKRKLTERAEEARKENERHLVQKALGDKKAMSGVAFLYEMPNNIMPKDVNAPENQGDRPGQTAKNFEIKFEWQKNAPRDSHFNTMGEVRNSIFNHKPFGIEVRNVKCMKCGQFGHSNVDRVCPMYGKVGDRDNPEWDLKKEEMEILASRLTQNSTAGFKLKDVAKQHVGDLSFDPSEKKSKKRREKEGEIEMEFLKTLNPKEKEQLLEKLEEQRLRKKMAEKKRKKAAKKELKAEMARQLASSNDKIKVPKLEFEQKPIIDSDEDDEPGPSTPVNIVLPKRKDEEKKAEILAAKKEFAKKLAEIKFMMEQDSDSSEDDSSDDSDESDDSDYETGSSPDSNQIKKLPKNMPPPPKPGMVLVKKKRAAPTSSKDEEADAKKKRIEDLKALESKMKMVRKRLDEKQKAELEKSTKRLQEIKAPKKAVEPTPIVNEDDLTTGLLDCIDSSRTQWKPTSLIAYDSDSD